MSKQLELSHMTESMNFFQIVALAMEVIGEVAADEAELVSAPPNTPTAFEFPANKVVKGIGRINGKRVDLCGIVLQVEP